jgi:hypothetical protein
MIKEIPEPSLVLVALSLVALTAHGAKVALARLPAQDTRLNVINVTRLNVDFRPAVATPAMSNP